MKRSLAYIFLYIFFSIFLYTIPAHSALLPVEQYLSVKLGYSAIMPLPATIKGTGIIPPTGKEITSFISTPSINLSVGTLYALGYIAVRGEIEYALRFASSKHIATVSTATAEEKFTLTNTVQTVLVNIFIDFNTNTFFVPYIGTGIGVAFVDSKFEFDSYSPKSFFADFSWMVVAGGAFYVVPSLAFDIQARYSSFGSSAYGSGTPARLMLSLHGIDIFFGIRYTL